MSKPLFEIGETVIRRAPAGNYPEYNGEYEVAGIISRKEMIALYPNMQGLTCNWYYKLKGLQAKLTARSGRVTGTVGRHSSERFLFKKHQPGEFSYNTLMASLKSVQPLVLQE